MVPIYNKDLNKQEEYIGLTTRNLSDRIQKHKADIKNGNLRRALAERSYEHNIQIKWEDAKVLKSCNNLKEGLVLESLEIIQRGQYKNVINGKTSKDISAAWQYALRKTGSQ